MFAGKRKEEINYDEVNTIVGQGTEFRGTIQARGTLRIEGRVEGEIAVQGDLLVSESGWVKANVRARHATVAGELEGDMNLSGRLEIAPSGKVKGKITVAKLAVSDGGFFQGNCAMGSDEQEQPKDVLHQKKQNGTAGETRQ